MTAAPTDPDLNKIFRSVLRAHAIDVAIAVCLFVALSFATGRVLRWAFDDELLTAMVAERVYSLRDFVTFFLHGGDMHPPLAFTLFYASMRLGLPEWALRAASLLFTAVSLGCMQLLALTLLAARTAQMPRVPTRLMAVLLFGAMPMALSQGDAIRWYPLFACLMSLFIAFVVVGRGWAARLGAAAALGLAACTNFLAVLVAAAYAIFRYGLQRRFVWRQDAIFWLAVGVFSIPGWWTFASIMLERRTTHAFGTELGQAIGTTALGFLGGDAIGIGNAWILLPLAVLTPVILLLTVDHARRDDPSHFLLLLLLAVPVMTAFGFAEPRSFLYLSPVFAIVILLFLNRLGLDAGSTRALIAALLVIAPALAAVANIENSAHPFKRNAIIPFRQIVDAIAQNTEGRVRVVSSEPVLAWSLQHERARSGLCATYFFNRPGCPDEPYDFIVVVRGQSNRSGNIDFMRRFDERLANLLAGRRAFAVFPVAFDRDARLKGRLAGKPVPDYVLSVEFYR